MAAFKQSLTRIAQRLGFHRDPFLGLDQSNPYGLEFRVNEFGWLRIFKPPVTDLERQDRSAAYVIGADVAEGLEKGDLNYAVVLRRPYIGGHFEQVAEAFGDIKAHEFATLLFTLGIWYNGAWIGVENNKDSGVNERLSKDYRYRNLHHQRQVMSDREHETDRPGWNTNMSTRGTLISDLMEVIDHDLITIHSKQLYQQLLSFRYNKHGKPEGPANKHDDGVFALAIAIQMHNRCPIPIAQPSEYESLMESIERRSPHKQWMDDITQRGKIDDNEDASYSNDMFGGVICKHL